MDITVFLDKVVGFLWGTPLLFGLLGTGLFFTVKSGFWQFRHLGFSIKHIGNMIKKGKNSNGGGKSGILSSYEAIATSLGSAVGVGNVAGVSSAIALGGPGALFWMWICALVGMATKMAEITLALHYRTRDENGEAYGGPTYYIEKGFKEKKYPGWRILASVFGFGILCDYFLGMSAYTVSEAVGTTFNISPIYIAIVFAISLTAVVLGGIKRLGSVLSVVVPFMCLVYIFSGIVIIIKDASQLPATFALIFESAFTPAAPIGGFAGASVALAFRTGIARSIYSNEAGWGTAPMIHSTAKVDHPVEQGVLGVMEVFIDTIIVCSITGLVVINTGAWNSGLSASELAIHAFTLGLGKVGGYILVLCIFLLGWTSVTAKYTMYEIVLRHVFGFGQKAREIIIKIMRSCMALPGLFLTIYTVKNGIPSSIVWLFADIVTGIPTFVNLISILLLSKKFFELLKDYNSTQFGERLENKERVKAFFES